MTMRPACLFDPDERTFLESINPRGKINPSTVRIPGTYKSSDVARERIPFEASSYRNRPSG
jgi:hypothetical protein